MARAHPMPSPDSSLNLLVTGGAGFIGSNLVLALQEQFPEARLTVIDDFRSGDFKNLAGYGEISSRKISQRSIGRSNSATKSSMRSSISPRSPTRPCTINLFRCTTTWKVFGGS